MSEQESIQYTLHQDGVAVVTFNRPDAHNALSVDAMRQFALTVALLHTEESLRAVVLTGAGNRAFCSGGDLRELSQHSDESFAREFITVMGDALLLLERLPVPVIAAVNGYALGGGSEIALACDLRILDASARLGFVQIRHALTPGWGAGQRLLRAVGYARALELLLTGRMLNAYESVEMGLAREVVPDGGALEAALMLARSFAVLPRETVHAIKSLLQAGLNHPYEDALQIERDLFPPLWASQAHLDAVQRVLESMNTKTNKE